MAVNYPAAETGMKRRDFLKTLALGAMVIGFAPNVLAETLKNQSSTLPEEFDDYLKDYLNKMKYFDSRHRNDIQIDSIKYRTFKSVVMRLRRLQGYAGHGNFQIMSLDDGIRMGRRSPDVGEFTKTEIEFLEVIFYAEAAKYGFFGQKPLKKLTDSIRKKDVIKIPYAGNYLYRGVPFETYKKIRQQVGEQAALTSGVRSVMKQFLLFLNKAYKNKGNLSLASRSLAPPGYSYHGIGDFDVGQAGFGIYNFTARFTNTEVYRRLSDLGYLKLRYPEKNFAGVRFEPWHIKVNT